MNNTSVFLIFVNYLAVNNKIIVYSGYKLINVKISKTLLKIKLIFKERKMKKTLLVILLMLLISEVNNLNGQTFELTAPISKPDTVIGPPESELLTSSAVVKNISAATASYKIALAPIYLTPGHLFACCDCENCYMPQEGYYQTPNPCVLEPQATSGTSVHVYLYPNNTTGTSIINVNFFNTENITDNAIYQAVFVVGTIGVNEPIELTLLPSDIIPNPGVDKILIRNIEVINYAELLLEVYNSKGVIVSKHSIPSGKAEFELNTEDLINGIYYYNISNNLKPHKTGSFVISR